MERTAVDWLFTTLDNMLELYPSEWEKVSKAAEQANAMEKDNALRFGIKCQMDFIRSNKIRHVEEIYNEIYEDKNNS
jgi:hypothetical protein